MKSNKNNKIKVFRLETQRVDVVCVATFVLDYFFRHNVKDKVTWIKLDFCNIFIPKLWEDLYSGRYLSYTYTEEKTDN